MSANCKHLIAIGDHKQLRPKLESYNLTVESGGPYMFNRSLFERLVISDFPLVTLNLQHRMQPQISSFIRDLTYPDLNDAESVKNHADIRGVGGNVLFINHEIEEGSDGDDEFLSKSNAHESEMVSKIVLYFLHHGYHGEDIVVLTPYLAQLRLLRQSLSKNTVVLLSELDKTEFAKANFDDVVEPTKIQRWQVPTIRVSTIDNFQGEEAKIIIASLVRSNKQGDIGFMGRPERINVLLSRARNGMFLLGNKKTLLKSNNSTWKQIFQKFENENLISEGFPAKITCTVHGHSETKLLKFSNDFDNALKAKGCTSLCKESSGL